MGGTTPSWEGEGCCYQKKIIVFDISISMNLGIGIDMTKTSYGNLYEMNL